MFGHPKESPEFWQALHDAENFDPATTLFVDDTARVLNSAAAFGLTKLVEVLHPDTSRPRKDNGTHQGIRGVSELID